MIELTDKQMQALQNADTTPPRIINPRTQEAFILVPVGDYERLIAGQYDDSPWTREELHAAAWEAGKSVGWEEMDDYDDPEDKP